MPRAPIQQACQPCRKRKIKCSGSSPCPACIAADLPCSFANASEKRGGNRGKRATVLNELRTGGVENNENFRNDDSNENLGVSMDGDGVGDGVGDADANSRGQSSKSRLNGYPEFTLPREARTPTGRWLTCTISKNDAGMDIRIDEPIIQACVSAYLQHIHPVVPFLTESIIRNEIEKAKTEVLAQLFVVAFCAYVVTFGRVLEGDSEGVRGVTVPGMASSRPIGSGLSSQSRTDTNTQCGRRLLDGALRIQCPGRIAEPTLRSVCISFFLYGAFAGLGDYRMGWFYLREATTLFEMIKGSAGKRGSLGMEWEGEDLYGRMFWVLYVSERAHAIRRNRPITLQITPSTPPLNSHFPIEAGLSYLTRLFRPFDSVFFAVWNHSQQHASKDWLLDLERAIRSALPPLFASSLSNEQIANLRVSQLWLRIKLWELFPRFGFLSSESVYECLTFRYPIAVASELMVLTMKLPIGSLQTHGVGMTEKIFDIACALADILPFISNHDSSTLSPPSSMSDPLSTLTPTDYLTSTASLLSKLPSGTEKFLPLLLAKLRELRPELISRLCEACQYPVPLMQGPMSPDTRGWYEEEVGRSLQRHLRGGVL